MNRKGGEAEVLKRSDVETESQPLTKRANGSGVVVYGIDSASLSIPEYHRTDSLIGYFRGLTLHTPALADVLAGVLLLAE